jgi:hypothetical protein
VRLDELAQYGPFRAFGLHETHGPGGPQRGQSAAILASN